MVGKKCSKRLMGALAGLVIMMGIVSSAFAVEVSVPKGFKFGTYTQKPWAGETIHVAMVAEPRDRKSTRLNSSH